ncbi:MAG: multidrug efflux RND transporter permease subunit [Zoogloeaceae bacterium]|jgi:HAE1 family hydrophobic/amphiphilic exporter-1/multidrug efflux pump|nr:multidrug efflux RND transporter permease subunit [Zoogloeaceae bacterium]
MFSKFFIDRPIFASVISIVIVIAGLVAFRVLPVAQYPHISPPTIMVVTAYPGASAETLAKTVAAPIEEQLNGLEGLAYFTSSATADGSINITVTFEVGTDPDMALVNVNNRVKIAEPRLPEDVRRYGVTVLKRSADILKLFAILSSKGHSRLFLSNYASINIVDELKRVPGVGDVMVFGAQDYSMRIWLRPDRMAQLKITTVEIAAAIREQNSQNAAGKIGQEPALDDQVLMYTVNAKGRLLTPEEFGNIVLRAEGPGGVLRVKDVARVELGANSYSARSLSAGQDVVGMGIFLQTGANALKVSQAVEEKMVELKEKFPEGMDYFVPFDTTKFISASIDAVQETLIEAGVLVLLVIFIFLQSWRATLIPMIAVPISLIGTFAGLWLFGFSINTLTLFAMVLAIGIVVDDAIIVLENVERLMTEDKMSPYAAAVEAMSEVSGALVAIVMVLCAVFIPVAFLGGIAGQLYKQFAVTVAVAVALSGTVALTLSPALCAILLKNKHEEHRFFAPFNRLFERFTQSYTSTVGYVLRHGIIGVVVFALVIGACVFFLRSVHSSFVPQEDQGMLLSALILPDGATLKRTVDVGQQMSAQVDRHPAVNRTMMVAGFDMIGGSKGTMFIDLKDWKDREGTGFFMGLIGKLFGKEKQPPMPAMALVGQFSGMGQRMGDGMALVFNPPAIMGLGSVGGFEAAIQNRADGDPIKLAAVIQEFMAAISKRPEFQCPTCRVTTSIRANVPQLFIEVDEPKAISLGLSLSDVYLTLQANMGALYVNDFNMGSKVYKVQLQAEGEYRMKPEDLGKVYVKSRSGAMIPVSAFSAIKRIIAPEVVERFNGFTAAKVMGETRAGVSSGDVIRMVEETAEQILPEGYSLAWMGSAYQEKSSAGSSVDAFAFALVMVFLILAALYEKWSLPVAVLMAVPFALMGALTAVWLRGMPNDIYFQIGLVVLIGLASKNAILIVEFAVQRFAEGMTVVDAAIEAARLRFRPIIMTSLAFTLGVYPLFKATGAGAAARRSMGTGVFGGMLAATFIAIIFVPLFFKWFERGKAVLPTGHKSHAVKGTAP